MKSYEFHDKEYLKEKSTNLLLEHLDLHSWSNTLDFFLVVYLQMITDNDLGFIANFLGIFIFALVIAYHYVLADPKYEGN